MILRRVEIVIIIRKLLNEKKFINEFKKIEDYFDLIYDFNYNKNTEISLPQNNYLLIKNEKLLKQINLNIYDFEMSSKIWKNCIFE